MVFCTRYGHFKYQILSFGFSNTPASFQGYITKIFAEKLDIFVVMYLDNILIYTKNLGQPYVEVVQWVLEQLQKHRFYANLKKVLISWRWDIILRLYRFSLRY